MAMTGELAGAADILTGAAIARAVEPDAGEGRVARRGDCLNCGTTLTGAHCHACGQKATVHRTLTAFWHDLAHSVLHFEGKIWHTLPLLFWRPGELTRRYIHGERAKFVSPLALFLFAVFLMFAVFSMAGLSLDAPANMQGQAGQELAKGVEQTAEGFAKGLAAIDAKIAAAEAKGENTGDLKRERRNVAGLKRMMEGGPAVLTEGDGKRFSGIKTGWARLDKGIAKANQNPSLLLYKLQANAYKFSWMLIPISVPFVWMLFFWKRRFKVYDHAIFVTYSLSFMMLLGILLTGGAAAGLPKSAIDIAIVLIPPLHMYKQLRGTYDASRLGALLRTFLLLMAGGVVVTLFVLLLVGMGLTG